jgi:hypothetical protein
VLPYQCLHLPSRFIKYALHLVDMLGYTADT